MAEMELKTLLARVEVKADGRGPGGFSGYGSVFGKVDRVGDTVAPGAFAKTLPRFVREGAICWGHDWNQPVAMVDEAGEDAHGLFLEATFHTHKGAQDARRLAQERIAWGKSMALSIGYRAVDWQFKSVEGQRVRELKAVELYEVSLVMVPAEPRAQVTAVKSARPTDRPVARGDGARAARDYILTALRNGGVDPAVLNAVLRSR